MAGFCDLMLALGMTLHGTCHPPAAPKTELPNNDQAAWSTPAPPPAPAAPAPATANFAPVVITKIIHEEAPPAAAPPPQQVAKPDRMAEAMEAAYQRRAAPLVQWPGVDTSATEAADAGSTAAPPMTAPDHAALATKYKEPGIPSTGPIDNTRIVATDRVISGVLETGINTQLDGSSGGPVIIQTARNVYGYHGRDVLIPRGSRLVCSYKSLGKVGDSRAPLKCSRLLLAGSRAEIYELKANATDEQGQLGVSGEVDNRIFEKYGTAFILAGVSAAVMAASSADGATTSSSSATPTGSSSYYSGTPMQGASQQLAQQLGQITAATLQQTINLTPILHIAQGTLVDIRPASDWYIGEAQ